MICSYLLLYSTISCSEDKRSLDNKENIIPVECVFFQIDEFVGNPYDIVLRDNLLIYYDRYDGKLLSTFDLKKNRIKERFLSEGNGPGEVVAPLYMLHFPEKDKLYIYQSNQTTLSIIDIPTLQIQQNIDRKSVV